MADEEQFRQLQAEMERRAHPPSEMADATDKARQFTAALSVTLCGRSFPLRPGGGLIALFRYVSRGTEEQDGDTGRNQAAMAAMHELLEDSVVPEKWPEFQRHALAAKATAEDVEPCIRQVIEAYTARPYMPGLRLLGGAAAGMAELDGMVLMGTGRGIATFSAREVCNLQLARLIQHMDQDAREVFLEDLYLDYSPEAVALAAAQAMIADKKRKAAEEAARVSGDDRLAPEGQARLPDGADTTEPASPEEAQDDAPAEADDTAEPAADLDGEPAAEEPAGGEAG